MAKLIKRVAIYADAKQVTGKTNRKKFDTKNLVGVVAFYNDGTRELEPLYDAQLFGSEVLTSKEYKIATAKMSSFLEPKSDGGMTAEERAFRKTKR